MLSALPVGGITGKRQIDRGVCVGGDNSVNDGDDEETVSACRIGQWQGKQTTQPDGN